MTINMESQNKILEGKISSHVTSVNPMQTAVFMQQLEAISDDHLLEIVRCGHSTLVSRVYGDEVCSEFEDFVVAHRKLFALMLESLDAAVDQTDS